MISNKRFDINLQLKAYFSSELQRLLIILIFAFFGVTAPFQYLDNPETPPPQSNGEPVTRIGPDEIS